MAWFQRRRRQASQDVEGDLTRRTLFGRRFLRGVPYVLPKDFDEVNRLDFQHYMLRYGLRGNYAAPVRSPERILDVGCGTGRWAIEIAAVFPQARVLGIDIVPPTDEGLTPGARPSNVMYAAGNVLEGLPYPDASFDFVHQRFMIGAIPREQWSRVVPDLARVTRPGGWVELVEAGMSRGSGTALQGLNLYVKDVLARRGLDIELGSQLTGFLEAAGLTNVTVREVGLPMGAPGGRVGTLAETDYFAAVTAMKAPVVALGMADAEHYDALIAHAHAEVAQGQCVFPIYVAFGQRA